MMRSPAQQSPSNFYYRSTRIRRWSIVLVTCRLNIAQTSSVEYTRHGRCPSHTAQRNWTTQTSHRMRPVADIHLHLSICHRRRPYRVECTGSLLTSEVKRRRARLVLGWGTAREDRRVLSAFDQIRRSAVSRGIRLVSTRLPFKVYAHSRFICKDDSIFSCALSAHPICSHV
jgi:hypothetical protein